MRQYTEHYTTLEMRRKVNNHEWLIWMKPPNGLFRDAEILAYNDQLTEAIETAQKIHIQTHGDMKDIEFRCVTMTRTVTATTALNDGWTDN